MERGHIHPISSLIREAGQIFSKMGFTIAEGPLLESEWYNFDALNVPKDHPARDMQDTFFIKDVPEHVLRTHCSPVQVRYMESQIKKGIAPPYRVIVPGKVFRNEATDMTHEAEFFQLEGLAVGEDITLAHLKGTLDRFYSELFKGADVEVRFRPSFFPFTEPSAEMDISCVICGAQGCPACKGSGWIEILGAGMVHPNVFKNVGYNPEQVTGFAFGMGVERIAMMKYGVSDIRLLVENRISFLEQF